MSQPFSVLVITGKPDLNRSWLVQRIADSRPDAIVFTPSHDGYRDHCFAEGYKMVILDDLMLFDPQQACETVERIERWAISNKTKLVLVIENIQDLNSLGIELQTEPMYMALEPDGDVTFLLNGKEERHHMDVIHHVL